MDGARCGSGKTEEVLETGSSLWILLAVGAVAVAAAVIITAIVAVLVFTDRRRHGRKSDSTAPPEVTALSVVGGAGNAKYDGIAEPRHGANGDVRKPLATLPACSVHKVRILGSLHRHHHNHHHHHHRRHFICPIIGPTTTAI